MVAKLIFRPFKVEVKFADIIYSDGVEHSLKELHFVHKTFLNFTVPGMMIVNEKIVEPLSEILEIAYNEEYPLRQAERIDSAVFAGEQLCSMQADNSYCYNAHPRKAPSKHSTGLAVDINPVENPSLGSDGEWYPNIGSGCHHRHNLSLGMLTPDHVITQAFKERGFEWGGLWNKPNYHHFEFMEQ